MLEYDLLITVFFLLIIIIYIHGKMAPRRHRNALCAEILDKAFDDINAFNQWENSLYHLGPYHYNKHQIAKNFIKVDGYKLPNEPIYKQAWMSLSPPFTTDAYLPQPQNFDNMQYIPWNAPIMPKNYYNNLSFL